MRLLPLYFAALAIFISGCTTSNPITVATPTLLEPINATVPDSTVVLQGTAYFPSGQPLLFGSIAVYQGSTLLKATEADLNGHYTLTLPTHTDLTLKVLYVGYETATYQLQPLPPGPYHLDVSLTTQKKIIDGLYCPTYRIRLIDMANTSSGATYHSSDLNKSPNFPGGL
ncbi:MAG: carboxypeptidase-like regulatory domain-containing protein [bacterium]|nr:carboxypeptidase-like regulatory domain-containing protein [bacterium]